MANSEFIIWISLLCLSNWSQCYGWIDMNPLKFIKEELSKERDNYALTSYSSDIYAVAGHSALLNSPQDGLKDKDKIESLPGQPLGVNFDQYSGYVNVDSQDGRSLFYYFVESPQNSSSKPLVLWLNGDANIIFLESPAGVGFSYSNITSDYKVNGDIRTARDSYTFLVNWLERFPEYKTRDFFIAGESYAGHYIPQLAQAILYNNQHDNQTIINLRGIAMGNALIDLETMMKGTVDFYWTHALMPDEIYYGVTSSCNFASLNSSDEVCLEFIDQGDAAAGNIYSYDIYAPLCNSSSKFNTELMAEGIRIWVYSGDTDGALPVTCTRYAVKKLGTPVRTAWYPWYTQGEVGGYAVGYQNLTFVTVRGAGHFVPSYQPARALVLFSSFINGTLPPPA
ncbi:Carboxypeptidase [Citrus sinensis]|uniref:Carboxypeptidase n=1 Tax=Citrus sinensis TaxID=2711 RepID=A0ACB8KVA9_CITSI|nr:Carboxypeptidase [Citrus sinensis]